MTPNTIRFSSLGLATAMVLHFGAVQADEYPSKTIEVGTHAANGGGIDVTTRMMMLRARRVLNQDMVVLNKKRRRRRGGA
ncbi:MAG: hypothetical protein VW057_11345 [Rhodospirillaceae bacterium]